MGQMFPLWPPGILPVEPEWPQLVIDLTRSFSRGSVVKRFLESTGGISRLEQGDLLFATQPRFELEPLPTRLAFFSAIGEMSAIADSGELSHLDLPPRRPSYFGRERDDGPSIPVLRVHAVLNEQLEQQL